MKTFHLDIITPDRQVFSEDVTEAVVPTSRGLIGILAGHIPLFTSLTEGEIKLVTPGKEYYLAIGGGFMEVTAEGASILVSRAYHATELNEAEIKKAESSAREAIANKVKGIELAQAQAILRRSSIEFKVLHRRKPRTTPLG